MSGETETTKPIGLDAAALSAALDALSDAVLLIDPRGRVAHVNAPFEALFGYAPETIIGGPLEALMSESADGAKLRAGERVLLRFRRRDGEGFPGETTATVIRDANAVAIGQLVTIRDVGAQRAAEETLHGLYALSAAIELTGPEKIERILNLGMAYFGVSNAVVGQVDAQNASADLYSTEHAIGPFAQRCRSIAIHETICSGLLATGAACEVLYGPEKLAHRRHFGLSGAEIGCYIAAPVYIDAAPIGSVSFFGATSAPPPANAGDFVQLFAHWIGYELARERVLANLKAAHELAESNYRLAEIASRAKSRFLANMSHELRTPLNAILGFADMTAARIHGDQSEKYFEYAADIRLSATNLLSMIDDLLRLSRLEPGALALAEEDFDPVDEIHAAILQMRPTAANAGLDLKTAREMPRVRLRADRRAFRQVLHNLLSNAMKFTDEGGSVLLDFFIGEAGDGVVRVTDTGCGIAEDQLARVFNPFEQSNAPDTAMVAGAGGPGLGLAVCRELMEAHKGQMALTSTLGEGAVASMIWPAERITLLDIPLAATG